MLIPSHHPRTLIIKKPRPIQITLARKKSNTQSSSNNVENVGMQANFGRIRGLSKALNLKQNNTNNSILRNFDLNSLKHREQKLKEQTRPDYKQNLGNIQNNSKHQGKHISMQTSETHIGNIIKTINYKEAVKDAQMTYKTRNNHQSMSQSNQDIQKLHYLMQSSKVESQYNSSNYSINGVKSRVRGLVKSLLKDNRQGYGQGISLTNGQNDNFVERAYEQKESTSILQESMCSAHIKPLNILSATRLSQKYFQNQPVTKQIKAFGCELDSLNQFNMIQQKSFQINSRKTTSDSWHNTLPEDCITIIDQKIQETARLKLQISQLSRRLENCLEQIDMNNKDRIIQKEVELQNRINCIKEQNQIQKQKLERRINILKLWIQLKQQSQTNRLNQCNKEIETQQTFQNTKRQLARSQQNEQITKLCSKVAQLNQKLYENSQTVDRSSTFCNGQTCQKFNRKYSRFQIEILRKKYHTLEQILESKEKQIHNKDQVIQMLIKKEVFGLLENTDILTNQQNKREKLKTIVSQLFTQLQENLTKL